ncbi:MAG: hypothetical protein VBE63_13185 [Lamprobacter sp.]|uniref:hypothetical protein n=1 Tax=Lamprobacter sp. TaxID=3100796 RepID=UPI002B25BCB1|nr:hypothetical protein [Lamprobacter sp.]MEA3640883.1 hypothetical protein [Lamprobacter sp.]
MNSRNERIKKKTCRTSTKVGGISVSALGATALALLLTTTGALAGPVTDHTQVGTVEIGFPSFNELFTAGYDSFTFHFNKGDFSRRQQVAAGAFGGEAKAVENDPFDPSTLYRSQDDVIFYCVDLFSDLNYNNGFHRYTVLALDDDTQVESSHGSQVITRDFGNVLTFLGALNLVLAENYGLTHGEQNWLNPTTGWMSGAIQAGIWESLYDFDNGMDINDGFFKVSGTGSGSHKLSKSGANLLSATFSRMESAPSLDNRLVHWFHIDNGQDIIGDPIQVPAPGSLILLLGGLIMLVNASRVRGHG